MVNGERGVESLSIAMILIQKSTFDDEMDDFANLKMCTTMMILAPWNIPLHICHLWIKTWHGIWIEISFQIMLYLLSSSNISFWLYPWHVSSKNDISLKSRKTFKYRTAIYRIEKNNKTKQNVKNGSGMKWNEMKLQMRKWDVEVRLTRRWWWWWWW